MFLLKDSIIYQKMKNVIGINKLKNFNHKDVKDMLEIHNNPIKQLDWLFDLHRMDASIEADKKNNKTNRRMLSLNIGMFILTVLSLLIALKAVVGG